MRSKINCILILLLTLAACNKDSATTNTLTGKWKLVKYHNLTTGKSQAEPFNISRSIIIEFSDNMITGKMDGHTVTNTVGGEYELLQDSKMKTLSFGGTKVSEPYWGDKFWDAIHAASSFERQTNKLFIHFNAGTETMEFRKR